MGQEKNISIYQPNLDHDNTEKSERRKQHAFWNLYALNNVHSLSQLFKHAPSPSKHTTRDHDWKDLYLLGQEFIENKKRRETFISRASRYFTHEEGLMDRVSWLNSECFELTIMKYEFWDKIRYLRPKSKEEGESKKIVKRVILSQKVPAYVLAGMFSYVFNKFAGISRLSFVTRIGIYGVCIYIADFVTDYKLSDKIFYRIPKLPDESLEKQKKEILNECLFFDGVINSFGANQEIEQKYFEHIKLQKTIEAQYQLAESLNLNIIKEEIL